MESLVVLTESQLEGLIERAVTRGVTKAKEEMKPQGYLTPDQLKDLFGYAPQWFRDKIAAGKFGKRVYNGDYRATYKEVEKYLFESKI